MNKARRTRRAVLHSRRSLLIWTWGLAALSSSRSHGAICWTAAVELHRLQRSRDSGAHDEGLWNYRFIRINRELLQIIVFANARTFTHWTADDRWRCAAGARLYGSVARDLWRNTYCWLRWRQQKMTQDVFIRHSALRVRECNGCLYII